VLWVQQEVLVGLLLVIEKAGCFNLNFKKEETPAFGSSSTSSGGGGGEGEGEGEGAGAGGGGGGGDGDDGDDGADGDDGGWDGDGEEPERWARRWYTRADGYMRARFPLKVRRVASSVSRAVCSSSMQCVAAAVAVAVAVAAVAVAVAVAAAVAGSRMRRGCVGGRVPVPAARTALAR
jgi:hypothetical protein